MSVVHFTYTNVTFFKNKGKMMYIQTSVVMDVFESSVLFSDLWSETS